MRCQLHLDVEAAAICVSCGRALCRDCQQTTRDERLICGLPQCAEFAKRQKAVQFAVRQTCVYNADNQLLMANLFYHLQWIFLVLGLGIIVSIPLAVGLGARALVAGEFVWFLLLLIGIISLLVALILHRVPKGLIAQARNWEDISREFDETVQINNPEAAR
jgi:hypothetical protein